MTYDVIVLGAGSAGCVLASRLTEDAHRSVCLVEAGPDYGPYVDGRWPEDLLFANELATSHDWGIAGGWSSWRARVVGGCSAHNGCFLAWGSRADFDRWAEAGNDGWSYADLEPYRRLALEKLRARPSIVEDLEPLMRAGLDAAVEVGLPVLDDFDDPDALQGTAPILVNAVGDVRWSTAFAYLDPARTCSNLTIIADALVDRLRFDGDRATGVVVRVGGDEVELSGDRIVLAAGAYCSPAILLRSGVGPAADLARLGVDVRVDLVGVGRNLSDHPRVEVAFRPSTHLLAETLEHSARRPARAQTLLKARSDACPPDTWDVQVMMRMRRALSADPRVSPEELLAHVFVHALKPDSRGHVRIDTLDPAAVPIVEHGFLSDANDRDSAILTGAVGLARQLAETRSMKGLLGDEVLPGAGVRDDALRHYVRATVGGYWHPVGTCRMGPGDDPEAVVDPSGLLRGFENVYVGDASIMPDIPRANTNLPVIAMAERIAESLRT